MKRKALFLVLLIGSSVQTLLGQASLTITIPNVRNSDGLIEIGIYDQKEAFPKEDLQYKVIIGKAKSPEFVIMINDLPLGEYAVALMHDENADGICNLNFLGIPKEGYGFSNNVRPRLSAPSFDRAKFKIDGDTNIVINLIYP